MVLGVVPVPLRATEMLALVALLEICSAPVKLPAAVGANFTWMAADCPAESVSGSVAPLWLKPVPVAAILLMVTATVEELLTVTV